MNQHSNTLVKKIMPLLAVFIFVNIAALNFKLQIQQLNINANVVMGANTLLCFVNCLSIALHKKAADSKNPNAIVRSMMMASLLKFIIVAFSVLIYIFIAKENRNVYGIFCGMGLYVIYTFLEVKIASKIKKDNEQN